MKICEYDPLQEFYKHEDMKMQEALRYPVCSECGERILSEWCYQFYDKSRGKVYICEDCIFDHKTLTPEEDW